MSDSSQGPGWWQASDGKWYPPEQAPGYQPAGAGGGAPQKLEIGAALGYGWNKFVQYIGQIIVIVLVIVVVQILFNVVGSILSSSIGGLGGTFLGFVFSIFGLFIGFLLAAGIIRVALAVTEGREPETSMLFSTDYIGPYIVASILVSLLFIVGLIACCIGAVVVGIFTLFYGYFVIDKHQGAGQSIGSSFNLVKDNFGSVLLLAIVVVVLNFITCGLAIGVTQIAVAYAYKTLTGEPVAA